MGRADDKPPPDFTGQQATILIVEDESLIRMSLTDHLEECGFRVLEAADAAEAVKVIDAKAADIDLVFSDVRMPGEMDGVGLAKWVRENYPRLPIFLASADATKSDLAKELCAHEAFFAKPYDVEKITVHIREILAARKAAH